MVPSQYYSETAAAKVPGVISYISELLESETKFLLFAHHKSMIGGLQEHLVKQNVNFILIEGNTPAEKRLVAGLQLLAGNPAYNGITRSRVEDGILS